MKLIIYEPMTHKRHITVNKKELYNFVYHYETKMCNVECKHTDTARNMITRLEIAGFKVERASDRGL